MENKKIVLWIAGGVLIAGGAYLAIMAWKKIKMKSLSNEDNMPSSTPNPITSYVKEVLTSKDDSFPLTIGSKGPNVGYLQRALNTLGASLKVDDSFGQKTYEALITKAGTKYWTISGVTIDGFTEIVSKANSLKSAYGANIPVTPSANTTMGGGY